MKSFGLISDLASILKKTKTDFLEIVDIAVAVLKQDWSHLSKNPSMVVSLDSKYSHYLNELTGWKAYAEEIKVKKAITGLVNTLSRKIGGAK